MKSPPDLIHCLLALLANSLEYDNFFLVMLENGSIKGLVLKYWREEEVGYQCRA